MFRLKTWLCNDMNFLKGILFSEALIKLLKGYYIKKITLFSSLLQSWFWKSCITEFVIILMGMIVASDSPVTAKTQQKNNLETITWFIPLLRKKKWLGKCKWGVAQGIISSKVFMKPESWIVCVLKYLIVTHYGFMLSCLSISASLCYL